MVCDGFFVMVGWLVVEIVCDVCDFDGGDMVICLVVVEIGVV